MNMELFVPEENIGYFLEIIKEIDIVDDYSLDREKFGKRKIKISSTFDRYNTMKELVPLLPSGTMMLGDMECPNKNYILCVGEMDFSDLNFLLHEGIKVSILTKKETSIRFNAWIELSMLSTLYTSNKIRNFSSINGKIEKETVFVFHTSENEIEKAQQIIHTYSNEYIIGEKKIYVKLMLKKFKPCYLQLKKNIKQVEIVDGDTFC